VQIEEQQSLIGSLQSDRTQMQDRLQQMQGTVEQVHLLETSLKETEDMLTDAQARNQSLQASKDVITTGLQLEIELLRQQVASLESTLHTERGYLSELRHDKETLQKQLELVTLRLPAPRVGFWSRIFGGGRKKEDQTQSLLVRVINY
jgi:chromosome segregation ATPase